MKKLVIINKKSHAVNKMLSNHKVNSDFTNVINNRSIKTNNGNSPPSKIKLKTENYVLNTPYFNKSVKDQINKYSDFKEKAD